MMISRRTPRLSLIARLDLVHVLICTLFALAASWAAPALGQSRLELPALIAEALARHPAMRSQQELARAARAGVEAARWQFWPTPSIAVEHGGGSSDDPALAGDQRVTVLRVQQPLWTGGRLSANLDRAEAQATIAQANIALSREQLALRVLQAWVDAIVANLKALAHQRSLGTHEELLALVRRRASEGVSARADVELATSRLESVRSDLSSSQAQREGALERLAVLVGEPSLPARTLPTVDDLSLPMLTSTQRSTSSALQDALDVSPQYAKAQAQVHVADADVEAASAARWPEVSLRIERQYGDFARVGATAQNRAYITVNGSFGAGLSLQSGIQAAVAQRRAALEEVQVQQQAIDEQLRADLVLARVAADRRSSLQRSRRAAVGVSESWHRQFLAGRKQWQDLMNAEREVAQVDVQLADAVGAEQLSSWRLAVVTAGVEAILPRGVQP